MQYPQSLAPSQVIGVVAPSFGATTEPYISATASAYKCFAKLGYAVHEWSCVRASDGIGISSTPTRCAQELMDAYCGNQDDVLISAGGGELMNEVISHLDFSELTAARPKWFMGYSDNTNFGFLLPTQCDVASIYAPCVASFGMRPWHPALNDAWRVLTEAQAGQTLRVNSYESWELTSLKDEQHPLAPYNTTEVSDIAAYKSGNLVSQLHVQGRLLGGCLDILINLCGTRFDCVSQFNERYAADGVVWYLEACDLGPIQVRRALWQLAEAGWFSRAKAFIFGRPLRKDDEEFGLTQEQAVLSAFLELGITVPVMLNADIGHLPPMMPLVCGSLGTVDFKNDNLSVSMALV
ncbi:S66 family peptidase [Atopobium fossor]|uniref:S66 family peptidase n=1 Tax=Atopobium fossor TaxID=39487 RepID=UPI0003F5CC02|nr:S66 peptidase family protein [Atopobium fossor]